MKKGRKDIYDQVIEIRRKMDIVKSNIENAKEENKMIEPRNVLFQFTCKKAAEALKELSEIAIGSSKDYERNIKEMRDRHKKAIEALKNQERTFHDAIQVEKQNGDDKVKKITDFKCATCGESFKWKNVRWVGKSENAYYTCGECGSIEHPAGLNEIVKEYLDAISSDYCTSKYKMKKFVEERLGEEWVYPEKKQREYTHEEIMSLWFKESGYVWIQVSGYDDSVGGYKFRGEFYPKEAFSKMQSATIPPEK